MRTCSHDKPQGWCPQFLHWHCKQRHEGRFFGGCLSDLSASRVWSGTRRLCDVLFWRHTSMAMVPWSLVTGRWLLPNKVNKESQVTWNGSDVEGITTVWWFGRKESIFFYWLYRKPFPPGPFICERASFMRHSGIVKNARISCIWKMHSRNLIVDCSWR